MCDFKPGDEVVCVDAGANAANILTQGATYTVVFIDLCPLSGCPFLNVGTPYTDGWHPSRFRKVQRKSTETGME